MLHPRVSYGVLCVLGLAILALWAGCGGGGGGGDGNGGGTHATGGGQTTITGQVVDATNVASGIPDTYVYVPLAPPAGTRSLPSEVISYDITDTQGNYRLEKVPGGSVTMVVEPPEASRFNPIQLDIVAPDAGEISIRVTLLPKSVSVTAVFVDPPSASLFTGDTQQFTATILGASGQQIEAATIWLVTGGVGSVDENGLFTASAPGTGRAVAMAGDKAGSATVQVQPRAGAVSGSVTNATTSAGIPGATVIADGKTATTNAQGGYTISGLAAGDYTLTAYANGYVQGSVDVTLRAGEGATANIALQSTGEPPVQGAGSIGGKVTDTSSGTPIAGCTVSAGGKTTTSDSDGDFTISNLSPTSYTVTASKSGYQDGSATVTVEAGKTVTANIALTPVAPTTGSISGTVTDASTGSPIANCTVSAGGKTAQTGSDGTYTIGNLTPGDYTVTASATGYVGGSAQVTVVAENAATADIKLTAGVEVQVPASVDFEATETTKALPIRYTGGGTLQWSVTEQIPWLTVAPMSGSGAADLALTVDRSGLSAEGSPYTGTLSITSNGGNRDVTVTCHVNRVDYDIQ